MGCTLKMTFVSAMVLLTQREKNAAPIATADKERLAWKRLEMGVGMVGFGIGHSWGLCNVLSMRK